MMIPYLVCPADHRGVSLHRGSLFCWSYRHNFCEHVGPDRGFEPVLFNEVNPDTKKVLKIVLEMDKPKKCPRTIEFYKDIHIARLFLLAPDIGAKYPKVGNAIPFSEFGQVCP